LQDYSDPPELTSTPFQDKLSTQSRCLWCGRTLEEGSFCANDPCEYLWRLANPRQEQSKPSPGDGFGQQERSEPEPHSSLPGGQFSFTGQHQQAAEAVTNLLVADLTLAHGNFKAALRGHLWFRNLRSLLAAKDNRQHFDRCAEVWISESKNAVDRRFRQLLQIAGTRVCLI
jgi:hypothetical protein